jgi:hypothetical protein
MLSQKWKEGSVSSDAQGGAGALRSGQVRTFRITAMDPKQKRIDVELAD